MEDLIIVAGIVIGIVLLRKHAAAQANTLPAANAVPTSDVIPTDTGVSGAAKVSGGYRVANFQTALALGMQPASGTTLPSYISPDPLASRTPPYYGGAAGGAGSGGNPLGGSLRSGVSSGTGTTLARTGPSAAELAARATGATRRGTPGAISDVGLVIHA